MNTKALMKYDPQQFQTMRVGAFHINGHRFERISEHTFRCPCGMAMEGLRLYAKIPPCPRQQD